LFFITRPFFSSSVSLFLILSLTTLYFAFLPSAHVFSYVLFYFPFLPFLYLYLAHFRDTWRHV
jgi:hypothetical protein